MATIVSYSGKELQEVATAIETAMADIDTQYGKVQDASANTGLGGTAGADIQTPLMLADEKMQTLHADLVAFQTDIEEKNAKQTTTYNTVESIAAE